MQNQYFFQSQIEDNLSQRKRGQSNYTSYEYSQNYSTQKPGQIKSDSFSNYQGESIVNQVKQLQNNIKKLDSMIKNVDDELKDLQIISPQKSRLDNQNIASINNKFQKINNNLNQSYNSNSNYRQNHGKTSTNIPQFQSRKSQQDDLINFKNHFQPQQQSFQNSKIDSYLSKSQSYSRKNNHSYISPSYMQKRDNIFPIDSISPYNIVLQSQSPYSVNQSDIDYLNPKRIEFDSISNSYKKKQKLDNLNNRHKDDRGPLLDHMNTKIDYNQNFGLSRIYNDDQESFQKKKNDIEEFESSIKLQLKSITDEQSAKKKQQIIDASNSKHYSYLYNSSGQKQSRLDIEDKDTSQNLQLIYQKPLKGHRNTITSIDINNSSDPISSSLDHNIIVWGEQVKYIKKHKDQINCLKVYNNLIISGSNDKSIKLFNIHNLKYISQFKGHQGRILDVVLQEQRNMLYSCSGDTLIKGWNLEMNKCFKSFEGHSQAINTIYLNNYSLYSGSNDKQIKVWDPRINKELYQLLGHQDGVTCIKSINDYQIISGGNDSLIYIWDIRNRKILQTKKLESKINCLELLNKNIVLIGSNGLQILDLESFTTKIPQQLELEGSVQSICVNKDKQQIFTGGFDTTVHVFNYLF